MNYQQYKSRLLLLLAALVLLIVASTRMHADSGTCGGAIITVPFTDVPSSNIFFCAIAEAYFSGLTAGTSPTTYSPTLNVTREQMAAFTTRTLDQSLRRGSRRAALDQWYTPSIMPSTALTTVGGTPFAVKSDGEDVWVTSASNMVSRVRASDGQLLGTWQGAFGVTGVLVARGRIFMAGNAGRLYSLDPTQPPGSVTVLTEQLGIGAIAIAYDGSRIWTANQSGSVSIFKFVCAGSCVTTVSPGLNQLHGILYDGANIWVTDGGDNTLKKLNADGSIIQTIPVGDAPIAPVFDGTNIWVPNQITNSVTVVRVKDAQGNPLANCFVLATLTGNGLNGPSGAAFDGQRILVTNFGLGDGVSLWKASDLTPLGSSATPSNPFAACSDGVNFWVTFPNTAQVGRF